MKYATLALTALITLLPVASAAGKIRIYLTESQALQVTGDAAGPDVKGSLSLMGGTSPENVEVMKVFSQRCPSVIVTSNRDKADFIVRVDHEPVNPTTAFVHGNKVAVFDRSGDLVHSDSTRLLGNAVKSACAAITRNAK